MHGLKLWFSKSCDFGFMIFDGSSIEIVGKEDGNFISLKILLIAVEFLIVLEKIDIEI